RRKGRAEEILVGADEAAGKALRPGRDGAGRRRMTDDAGIDADEAARVVPAGRLAAADAEGAVSNGDRGVRRGMLDHAGMHDRRSDMVYENLGHDAVLSD